MLHPPEDAIRRLESRLSSERFRHSVGVYETCVLLADAWKNYPVDRDWLMWAALFHDCGKELSGAQTEELLNDEPLRWGAELMEFKKLRHAPLGAKLLQMEYGVENDDVLKAVAYHPTGSPELTPIGWMVYIADYLEPNRSGFEDREMMLEQACADPMKGLRLMADLRIQVVKKKGKTVHPLAVEFRKYLKLLGKP
ncbi:MAG: bis(5'-nucleosyl)-tetraphosphatase (symmetrical) YqeK [Candidatus Omnitrophota bacterium]